MALGLAGLYRELISVDSPEILDFAGVSATARRRLDKDYRDIYEELTGLSLYQCPACHLGRMVLLRSLQPIKSVPLIIDTS
jgi:hypothetical protein